MDTVRFNERLASVVPYDPKYLPADILLSANESPRNLPDDIRLAIRKRVKKFKYNRYPDPLANELRDLIAQANGLERENVLMGNGGDELLFYTALAFGGPGKKVLNAPPTFSVYEYNAFLTGAEVVNIPRRSDFTVDEEAILERVAEGDIDYIILTSPNNPTGQLVNESFLNKLLSSTDALVLVDEAYGEFARTTCRPLLWQHKNLVILRTFSKAFACAGVRLGYILGDAQVIAEYVKVRLPYSVDSLSQMIGCAVYENRQMFSPSIERIILERERMTEELQGIEGMEVFPSDANFILVRLKDAADVWQQLLDRGILVRNLTNVNMLEDCLRFTVGTHAENDALLAALKEILSGR